MAFPAKKGSGSTLANKMEDKYSKSLKRRHEQQVANKDSFGGGGNKKNSLISYKDLPEGMNLWWAKPGEHVIDIIPFECGPDMPINPKTGETSSEEGDFDYLLDLQVHQRIGELQLDYVCPRQNFGLPCPICSYLDANRLELEQWKKVRTSRKVIYLVWVHDTPEEEAKGLQIWSVAHFNAEANITSVAKLPRGGGYKLFSHPTEGSQIYFEVSKEGKTKIKYEGFQLIERDRPIPKKLLDMAISLDQIIKMHPSYEDIEKAFKGTLKLLEGQQSSEDAGSNFSGSENKEEASSDAGTNWYGDEGDQSSSNKASSSKPSVSMKKKFSFKR